MLKANGRCFYITAAFALISACGGGEPPLQRYSTDAFDHSRILGTWHPTQKALRDLASKTKFTKTTRSDHEMIFLANGSCKFRSHWQYSYVDEGEPEESSYYLTDQCAWKIGTIPARVKDVVFEATAVSMTLNQGSRNVRTYFYIVEVDRRLVLWQSIGEPDWGYYMDFVKDT